MTYAAPEFFALLAVVVPLFGALRGRRGRAALLVVASLLFYAWAGALDTLVFLAVVAASWLAAWAAGRWPAPRRLLLGLGIGTMAAHLAFWKYGPWLAREIGGSLDVALPVGISFFTLQGIAYLVDVGRGRAPVLGFGDYLLFKSFFAQLVAGPIVRAHQLLPQLRRLASPRAVDLAAGLGLFCLGLFKKIVIADRCAPLVDATFADPGAFGRAALALGLAGYAVQIWADFSGYTDMGRGAGRLLGIRLPENFHSPYLAASPSAFWRRWHVTLSEWIRDYVYVPLGGSRGSRPRVWAVALLTMLASGLWHGADWTFALWGLYHGGLLLLERGLRGLGLAGVLAATVGAPVTQALAGVATQAAVLGGWLLFRAEGFAGLRAYLRAAAEGGGGRSPDGTEVLVGLGLCLVIQVVGFRDLATARYPVLAALGRGWDAAAAPGAPAWRARALGVAGGVALALLLVATVVLRASDRAPAFIYFQF
jgi:alginate O-acetyltransferase complex protein AlgI